MRLLSLLSIAIQRVAGILIENTRENLLKQLLASYQIITRSQEKRKKKDGFQKISVRTSITCGNCEAFLVTGVTTVAEVDPARAKERVHFGRL